MAVKKYQAKYLLVEIDDEGPKGKFILVRLIHYKDLWWNSNQYQIPKCLLLFSVYSLISNSSSCKHVSGNNPYQCFRDDVGPQSICEDHCTGFSSCVAYDYGTIYNFCYLYPSVRSCPSGFSAEYESGPIAATMTDFRKGPNFFHNMVCYGKN